MLYNVDCLNYKAELKLCFLFSHQFEKEMNMTSNSLCQLGETILK